MKKNKALAVPFVLWAVLFIAVPLAMVVWYGVTVEETPAYVEVAGDNGQTLFQLEDGTVTAERPQKRTVVSLANFRRMLEPTYLKLLLRSLKIALFTTIICLLLGYPVALILSSRDFKRPGLWLMLIILPMWMHFLLRTYSWMSILENSGILNSWIASLRDAIPAFDRWLTSMGVGKKIIFLYNEKAVVLGMVYNYLSFMIMPIYTVIEKTDHSLLEAAADLGAYSGDTARELLAVSPRLERLYAFEPDSRTRRRLARTVDGLNAEYPSCAIDTVTAAAWSTDGSLAFTAHGNRGSGGFRPSSPNDRDEDIIDARALDSVLDGSHVDYIKYDVEGCEREALLGSADTIRRCLPELRLSLYHRPCDMWELPLLLHDICPKYRMHLFRSRCLPAWETELCAAAR